MNQFLVRYQMRKDGGWHLSVEFDGEVLLELFEKGKAKLEDPVLKWMVHLFIDTEFMPSSTETLRGWLLDHEQDFVSYFKSVRDQLEVGLDERGSPWTLPSRRIKGLGKLTGRAFFLPSVGPQELESVFHGLKDLWRAYVGALRVENKLMLVEA